MSKDPKSRQNQLTTDANPAESDDGALFRDAVSGIKKFEQDKIQPESCHGKKKTSYATKINQENRLRKRASAAFEFSDGYQAWFSENGPIKWVREGYSAAMVKRLRRGEVPPELTLDLHGYTRAEAKQELAAMLQYAEKHHLLCVCIVHGIGSKVLKQAIPSWLVQHPLVLGFHNAPLEYGGDGALLVWLNLDPAVNRSGVF